MRKLQNIELGRITADAYRQKPKRPVAIVLDNIRSAHNVGAAFRTADAFAVQKVILCGICASPPNAEIHKAALGAEFVVEWQYYEKTEDALLFLRSGGYCIIAVEQVEGGTPLHSFGIADRLPAALVFGNEVNGVSQEALDLCQYAVEIPQEGTKHSLNVSVSIGIALWELCGCGK